jgi:hypothetical protein
MIVNLGVMLDINIINGLKIRVKDVLLVKLESGLLI